MVIFKLLLQSSGLSTREASRFLNVSVDTIKSWSKGKYNYPEGAALEMLDLIKKQNNTANETINIVENIINKNSGCDNIEIGFCCDDFEAQDLGFPCKSAHDAVIRRIIECVGYEDFFKIKLVPRGSTLSTAAAEI